MARYIPDLRSPMETCWIDSCTQVIDVAGGWRLPEAFQSPDVELKAAKEAVVLGDDVPVSDALRLASVAGPDPSPPQAIASVSTTGLALRIP